MINEQAKKYVDAAMDYMSSAVAFLGEALAHIRAGKANVKILDGIKIDYYGTMTLLSGVATITTPDAKTIFIQPWEKNLISAIERAILNSDVGITPANNGEIIRLGIPPLTEERRKQLVKQSGTAVEDAKISIRNARRDAIEHLKKEVKNGMPEDVEKDGEMEVQKIHDKYIKKIDELFAAKEKEIMTV
jgi:ribosome recycling factor